MCVFSSYGSVHKAIHKESKQTLAVKKVPVDVSIINRKKLLKKVNVLVKYV